MRQADAPEFTAATLPQAQQWEGQLVWRKDLKAMQYSDGRQWLSLVGQDAAGGLQAAPSASPLRSALFVGDSITDYARVGLTATITNLGNGTANVNRASHSMSVGQRFGITADPDPVVNVMRATVLSVTDANNYIARLDGPVHNVTGGQATILIEDRAGTRGWPNWLELYAGEPLRRTWAAIGGGRIGTIIDLLPKLGAGSEDMAFICIGMNDIYSAGDSLATMQANWAAMMALVRARSGRIVVLSVPPRSSADGAWTEGKQTIHTQWNRWLYEQCVLNGWEFVDTWLASQGGATYVNAAAANPDPLAAMVHDNTHPSMRGAAAIGAAVWAKVSKWFGAQGWRAPHPDAIGADAGNLLTGSTFATDSGGVATGWASSDGTAGMNVTPTMEARTIASHGDACGRNQVLTINYGSAAGTASTRLRLNNIQALLTPGQRYQFAVQFSVTGAVGLVGLEAALFGTLADGTFWQVISQHQDSNADPMVGDFSGWLLSPIATCPPNLSDLDAWVRPYITSAQVGDLVLKLWQPQLRRVG